MKEIIKKGIIKKAIIKKGIIKKFVSLCLTLTLTISSVGTGVIYGADNECGEERFDKLELLINQMMEEDDPRDGSLWNKENTSAFKWSYINGCMASVFIGLYDVTGDNKYLSFADNYMSPFIATTSTAKSGYINTDCNYKITNYALDDLNGGKALIELIADNSANKDKYTNAVSDTLYTKILQAMLKDKTTAEGNLWHKNAYPYQVWLDGIYMETPFWLEYELEMGDADSFITASNNVTNQIENVYTKLRNSETGLYYHGYDAQADKTSGSYKSSSAMSWAEKGTGHSASYWLRGTGWYAMALVDDIDFINKAEKRYSIDLSKQKATLVDIYTDLMNSMLKYRDENTKLWYQVIDKGGEEYNYLETSGSAAMSYALMKGYNIGIADKSFYKSGLEVFNGICDNKLNYTSSAKTAVNLEDICQTAGLAGPSSGITSGSATIGYKYTSRDGSYKYYVSEKTVSNDAKGIAPLIFAYCQVLSLKGDVDMNGSVDAADAALALRYVTDLAELSDKQLALMDCNGDEKYDMLDVIAILTIADEQK